MTFNNIFHFVFVFHSIDEVGDIKCHSVINSILFTRLQAGATLGWLVSLKSTNNLNTLNRWLSPTSTNCPPPIKMQMWFYRNFTMKCKNVWNGDTFLNTKELPFQGSLALCHGPLHGWPFGILPHHDLTRLDHNTFPHLIYKFRH